MWIARPSNLTKTSGEQFCDLSTLVGLRHRIALSRGKRLAFLVLSGSFNPVHTEHLRAFDLAREHLEGRGWAVVAGFLVPSSDSYLREKLQEGALSLSQRIALCRLAIEDNNWLSVCTKEEFSSNRARRAVQSELEEQCQEVLGGRSIKGVEIMGSDTVVRIFSKIIAEPDRAATKSSQQGRAVCYLLRSGPATATERKEIKDILAPQIATLGVELLPVESASEEPQLKPVSSSAIRELVVKRDWKNLRSKGWLPPQVLEALETFAS